MPDHEMRRRRFLTLAATGATTSLIPGTAQALPRERARNRAAYLGSFTWTTPPGHGFDIARHHSASGKLTSVSRFGGVPDASWMDFSPSRRFLYTTNELTPEGAVTALDVTDPFAPEVLNTRSSRGGGPTHLSVHPSGRFLLTANYTDGSVVVHHLREDGRVGASTDLVRHVGTTRAAKAHQVLTDPSGNWVVAVDLGADAVYTYALDTRGGELTQHRRLDLPTGTGPRHLAFHPDGEHAYLLAELASTVTVLSWDSTSGAFTPGQVLDTRGDHTGGENAPAEIAVSSDGRFAYATNRGDDTIAILRVGDRADSLKLLETVPTGGSWPRHCALSPEQDRLYVANQRSGTVTSLPRDPATGSLRAAELPVDVPGAAMVAFPS